MPELPDLTVFAENLDRVVVGRKVQEVAGDRRLEAVGEELNTAAAGAAIERVERAGKEIDFLFSTGVRLRIHLMLAGRFVLTDNPERLGDRMLTIRFAGGAALVVADPKGLVKAVLDPPPTSVPDALSVDAAYLRQKAALKPRTPAKAFLLDQAVLRGIGNAYADEILWAAKVSPKAAVGKIPREALETLATAITSVLTEAINKIKAAAPDIIGGEIRDFLAVHHPRRTHSPTGHPIVKEQVAGKTTYFTDEQVLY